jgi:methyl-accepting chemotaxis protein
MRLKSRKIYFIKKDFQSRFILRFVAVATVWAAAAVLLFASLAKRRLEEVRYSSSIDITTTRELLLPITVGAHIVSLLIVAGILAYAIHALWRRLSAPLSTIKSGIAGIARGELAREIVLGKDEEFQDLAADLNGMRSALRDRIVRIKKQQQELAAAAAEFNRAVLEGKPPAPAAASLRIALERLREELNAFR